MSATNESGDIDKNKSGRTRLISRKKRISKKSTDIEKKSDISDENEEPEDLEKSDSSQSPTRKPGNDVQVTKIESEQNKDNEMDKTKSEENVRSKSPEPSPESVKTNEKTKNVESVKTNEKLKLVEPVKTNEKSKTIEAVKTNEKKKTVEPIKSPEKAKAVEIVKSSEKLRTVEPIKSPEREKPKSDESDENYKPISPRAGQSEKRIIKDEPKVERTKSPTRQRSPSPSRSLDELYPQATSAPSKSKRSLAGKLKEYGYVLLNTLLVTDGKHQQRYVECVDKLGHKVFVSVNDRNLDDDNALSCSISENSLYEIPASLKVGALSCCGLEIEGVIFPCDSEYCVITRDIDGVSLNELILQKSQAGTRNRLPSPLRLQAQDDCPVLIPYPLLRFEDIKENCKIILKATSECTNRIRNVLKRMNWDDLSETLNNLDFLKNEINYFTELYREKILMILETLPEAEKILQMHHDLPKNSLTEENRRKAKAAEYNVQKRHDFLISLLTQSQQITGLNKSLLKLISKVQNINENIELEMANVDGIIDE